MPAAAAVTVAFMDVPFQPVTWSLERPLITASPRRGAGASLGRLVPEDLLPQFAHFTSAAPTATSYGRAVWTWLRSDPTVRARPGGHIPNPANGGHQA